MLFNESINTDANNVLLYMLANLYTTDCFRSVLSALHLPLVFGFSMVVNSGSILEVSALLICICLPFLISTVNIYSQHGELVQKSRRGLYGKIKKNILT